MSDNLTVHVEGVYGPPGLSDDLGMCCMGAAVYGESRCTCWEPIYDLNQRPLQNDGTPPPEDAIPTRSKCCHDCAYRNDSPEREDGQGDFLDDLAVGGREEFWCHQGIRRIIAWRHPDGRELPAAPGDYRPPQTTEPRPAIWKADGTVGERCAGWASTRKGVTGGIET